MRRTADHGGFVKKDPAERLVSEEHDRGAHIEQAIRADFPFLGDRYELPKTYQAAITTLFSMEEEQPAKWRAQQVRGLRQSGIVRCQSMRHGSAKSQTSQQASRT
jgi:hypothetical protein